ncbi:DUF6615 family protein [Streptomyces sp. NPDC005908]|uniref:DUF6615 family protein n=1 Tax=Streptomyces sp. NPDC005908 TaxID=3157084 RepID=UPI0033D2D59E
MCRTLRACATRTFERLALDHFTGSASGEEMYTQLNLGDLQRLHSDRIVVREFHRRQEARNGADWEWWFHTAGRGFGMRVQAKRTKRGGGYDLEHVVRTTGERQSELLVGDALAAGCLPIYVLYNHRNWVPRSPTGLVVDCRHGRGSPTQLGCTIVSALTVQAVLRDRPIRASYVRDRSMPWHRVLCDAPDTGRSGLEAAQARPICRSTVVIPVSPGPSTARCSGPSLRGPPTSHSRRATATAFFSAGVCTMCIVAW